MLKVPFLDLKKVNEEIQPEIQQALDKVLQSGWYILGKSLRDLEVQLAQELDPENTGYVVGCNSGTDALILSLLATGVKYGDEVLTVSHTAIPTIAAIVAVGAKPIFVDIDPQAWVMDASKIKGKLTRETKALIAVHLYGNMVDVVAIRSILNECGRNDIIIIEDVAQAQGSTLNGKQAGTLGDYGAFSFYPSKNIGALGDGGAIYCKTATEYEKLCMLRNYGQRDRYNAIMKLGINSRLDDIQAAILSVKLPHLHRWIKAKSMTMDIYKQMLGDLPLTFQKSTFNCQPAWHLCVIALDNNIDRNTFMDYLKGKGIQTLVHYPIPTHRQEAFRKDVPVGLPLTEELANRIVSLPFSTVISRDDQEYVTEMIRDFFSAYGL